MAEGLLRDLLLLNLEQKDRLQHLVLLSALDKSLNSLPGETEEKVVSILNKLKLIAQAKEYLSSNVNPRLILEQLIINL
jgi:hypothetical protein